MALHPGARLGPYEILVAIGAGGMGEVYHATDTKLGRGVAIKVLPDSLASDPDRIARFEREAKSLAALNHPHIAQIYGFETIATPESPVANHLLVLEYVDGETLAERIARGPINVAEVVTIARQMADALEAAHEKGIIHRDLKPANVKITSDEKVKVLDFGLAKALDPVGADGPGAPGGMTLSPTLSIMATRAGMILGTAAYMSPEQAKGSPADQRSDIFSFGVVLFEMLTGRKPFHGETVPEVLASVMVRDPNLDSLPSIHPRLRELVQRCLQKNPKQRWQHIGDLRSELESIAVDPTGASSRWTTAAPTAPLWRRAMPFVATAIAAASIAGIAGWMLKPSTLQPVTRFSITLPEGQQFTNAGRQLLAVSPDGTQIVYVANSRLYLRAMSDSDARPIQGAEGGASNTINPAFSPDGRSIVFYAEQTLRRIAVAGGTAITLCQATNPLGISWAGDYILFGQGAAGIQRVAASGGKPEMVVTANDGETLGEPQLLPDGKTLLYTVGRTTLSFSERWEKAQIVAQAPNGQRRVLVDGGSDGRYLPSGHLVYSVGGVLFAAPFDVNSLRITGPTTRVVEGIRRGNPTGIAQFATSATGTMAFVPGPVNAINPLGVTLSTPNGPPTGLKIPAGPYGQPRLSPDGKRLAVINDDGREAVILLFDVAGRDAPRRLTIPGRSIFPVWSPDGQYIAFSSDREYIGVFRHRADGTGTSEQLTKPEPTHTHLPLSWSADGKYLLLIDVEAGTLRRLAVYSTNDRKLTPFGDMKNVIMARMSPDGRWIAYATSENTARVLRIYVQPFPSDGTIIEIANGAAPIWAPDNQSLWFNEPGARIGRVAITARPTFSAGAPEYFARPAGYLEVPAGTPPSWDVTADGRILAIVGGSFDPAALPQIQVVLNWLEELKQRVPTK